MIWYPTLTQTGGIYFKTMNVWIVTNENVMKCEMNCEVNCSGECKTNRPRDYLFT